MSEKYLQENIKNLQNINKKIPKNGYLIAKVFHVFCGKILLQKHLDCYICSIPYTAENFSKKPWTIHKKQDFENTQPAQ